LSGRTSSTLSIPTNGIISSHPGGEATRNFNTTATIGRTGTPHLTILFGALEILACRRCMKCCFICGSDLVCDPNTRKKLEICKDKLLEKAFGTKKKNTEELKELHTELHDFYLSPKQTIRFISKNTLEYYLILYA
jgi:hypothetical protein